LKTKKYLYAATGTFAIAASLMLSGCNNGGGAAGGGGGATTGGDTVATVGDASVSREEIHTLLEANGGEQALRQLIDYNLVMQNLKTQGLEVTDAEVQAALDRQGEDNPLVKQALTKGGPQAEALRRTTRYQLALDKILTKDVKVDAAAQQKWFTKNKANYDKPAKVKIGVLFASTKARADVMAGQLKSKAKTFQELVEEQKKANDPIAASSTNDTTESSDPNIPAPGYLSVDQLPEPMKSQALKLEPGTTSGVLQLKGGQPAFVILRLIDRQAPVQAKASDPQPTLDYKLEQVARGLVKENPQNPPFDKTIEQVRQAIMQQGMQQGRFEQPSYRDVLTYINQTGVQKLLTTLRTSSNVTINDAAYQNIAQEYKPVPTPTAATGAEGGAATGNAATGDAATGNAATGNAAP
jgi:foldase protein PrsA